MISQPLKQTPTGQIPCEVSEATHLRIRIPGPSGVLTLPVMIGGARAVTGNWTWNGSVEKPSLRPSVLTKGTDDSGADFVCHSWITDGQANFLQDCTHMYQGKTIDLLPVVQPEPEEIDFSCYVCGVQCASAPPLPGRPVCEEHCDDHDYLYDLDERTHSCIHCGKPADDSFYDRD